MGKQSESSRAEKFGRWSATVWRHHMRQEARFNGFLRARGVSEGGAVILIWILKIGLLGMLAYYMFWLMVVVCGAVLSIWLCRRINLDPEDEPEWRDGASGYGQYRNGTRIDVGISDDD